MVLAGDSGGFVQASFTSSRHIAELPNRFSWRAVDVNIVPTVQSVASYWVRAGSRPTMVDVSAREVLRS